MLPKDKTISMLNALIDSCKNGEKGFRESAESVHTAYYQILLSEAARERGVFAKELQSLVRRMGGQPDRKGTVAGTLHRGWINLKAAMERGGDAAILFECCRGEEIAAKHYEEAFKMDLAEPILSTLERQYSFIRLTLRHLHALESEHAENFRQNA